MNLIHLDDDGRQGLDVRLGQFAPAGVDGPDGGRGAQLVQQAAQHVHILGQGVVLDQGRIVEAGTHDELMAGCPLYAGMYRAHIDAKDAA